MQEYDKCGWPISDASNPGGKRFILARYGKLLHYQRGESQHDARWLISDGAQFAYDVTTVCGRLFEERVLVSDELFWKSKYCPRCLAAIDVEALAHE